MRRFVSCAVLSCAALSITHEAGAAISLNGYVPQYDASVYTGASFDVGCNDVTSGGTAQAASCSSGFGLGAGGSSGAASAHQATLHASTEVDVWAPNSNLSTFGASSTAVAHLNDYLYFTGPANTQVRVNTSIIAQGSIFADATGWASNPSIASSSFAVMGGVFGQSFGQSGRITSSADGTLTVTGSQSGATLPVSFLLNFDSQGNSQIGSLQMTVSLQSDGTARGHGFVGGLYLQGTAYTTAGFGNTVYWGGITSATDTMGNAIDLSQLHAFSASGFDYMTSAVPEAGTVPMLLSGLTVLFLAVRRRKPIN